MNNMRKYRELLESLENGKEAEEMEEELKDYKDDFSDLEEDRYEEELPGDEDMGMDSSLDMDNYDLDSELDMEIARDGLEDDYMGDDEEYVAPEIEPTMEPEMGGDPEAEDDVIFNYTATIQLTGYDFPLVVQADDMEEIKTVMRVMQQSGLNPKGDYKWNSKTFEIDLDESVEDKEKFTESVKVGDEVTTHEGKKGEVIEVDEKKEAIKVKLADGNIVSQGFDEFTK